MHSILIFSIYTTDMTEMAQLNFAHFSVVCVCVCVLSMTDY